MSVLNKVNVIMTRRDLYVEHQLADSRLVNIFDCTSCFRRLGLYVACAMLRFFASPPAY